MTDQFKALVVDQHEDRFSVSVRELAVQDLPEGEVLIKVCYQGEL